MPDFHWSSKACGGMGLLVIAMPTALRSEISWLSLVLCSTDASPWMSMRSASFLPLGSVRIPSLPALRPSSSSSDLAFSGS